MSNDGRNNTHVSKTLDEAIEALIAKWLDLPEAYKGKASERSVEVLYRELQQLRAAYGVHRGETPNVARQPYEASVKSSAHSRNELIERHESYGLISVSRVNGGTRLFGSSVEHQHFFRIEVKRGRRMMRDFGEDFTEDYGSRLPNIVDIDLSAAQFVDMIASMNVGSGIPCTLRRVDGVQMEPVPDSAGSELKLMHENFGRDLAEVGEAFVRFEQEAATSLSKMTKKDREATMDVFTKARRFFDDHAPYAAKLFGEHVEKAAAKGKMEVDAFIQTALRHAGIKAIEDAGGVLKLTAPQDTPRLSIGAIIDGRAMSGGTKSGLTIRERLFKIIETQLDIPIEDIHDDSNFVDDLGADSLAIVEITLAAEEAFNIDISDEEVAKCATVGDAHRALMAAQIARDTK